MTIIDPDPTKRCHSVALARVWIALSLPSTPAITRAHSASFVVLSSSLVLFCLSLLLLYCFSSVEKPPKIDSSDERVEVEKVDKLTVEVDGLVGLKQNPTLVLPSVELVDIDVVVVLDGEDVRTGRSLTNTLPRVDLGKGGNGDEGAGVVGADH